MTTVPATGETTAGGRRPRRARRRDVFDVVGARELVSSSDPTADAALPAWARTAVYEGRVIIRRPPTAVGDGVVVVLVPSRPLGPDPRFAIGPVSLPRLRHRRETAAT